MKPPSGKNIRILFFTKKSKYTEIAMKTLSHVYPGVNIETCENIKNPPESLAALNIIDTEQISGVALDHVLDQLSDGPAILLVRDFASVRTFGKYLSGRTSIITRDDLGGMGLIQATHHLLERQKLHKQLRKTSRHLKELAIRDELTGFFNNRHFQELLTGEVKKANRYRRPLGLVIIAIKNLCAINKTFGHNEGDRILARTAETIRDIIRDVDIPARYGDNEFAIILPESDEDAAGIVVRRIQNAMEEISLKSSGDGLHLILSCGIAALSYRIQTREDLLRTALGALIEAKKNGDNAICTSEEVEAKRRVVRENRQLIEQLSERLGRISNEAQRNYFQSLMKAIGEIPILKKLLMPHSERVAFFAKRLAESFGLEDAKSNAIYRAGLLHDAGKLAIDSEILTKPTRLSLAEQDLIQKHPVFAVQIIGQSPFLSDERGGILHHHERFDGEGYPERLSGDSIPLSARILSVAEAWDVMTTPQPYRMQPLSLDAAIDEIQKGSGQQFDPDLVDCFTGLITG